MACLDGCCACLNKATCGCCFNFQEAKVVASVLPQGRAVVMALSAPGPDIPGAEPFFPLLPGNLHMMRETERHANHPNHPNHSAPRTRETE